MNCFICYDLLRQTIYFLNALLVVCFVSKQSKSCMKEKKARCHHSNLDREERNSKYWREEEELIVALFCSFQSKSVELPGTCQLNESLDFKYHLESLDENICEPRLFQSSHPASLFFLLWKSDLDWNHSWNLRGKKNYWECCAGWKDKVIITTCRIVQCTTLSQELQHNYQLYNSHPQSPILTVAFSSRN